ncbi:MAG: FAD-dependent oxidoreductase [Lachnospiraceae bacterium]|nr:FAD-dependent oxidoreductase [Lachnospiraceae bacterium]
MYRVNQIKLNIFHSEADFKNKVAKTIGVSVADIDWSTLIILHRSIDARNKSNILFVYNVAFDFVGATKIVGESIASPNKKYVKSLEEYSQITFNPIIINSMSNNKTTRKSVSNNENNISSIKKNIRPIVVGFGPAGIFASYIFALNGLKPIIVERGKAIEDRIKDVDKFFESMELDENSNVCFGEGGAGAFSDGKLNTNNKDKTGVYRFVLETFVKFGADEKILYENLPHVGTDKLVEIIKNIRNEIIKLGGEIHYNTKLCFNSGLAEFVPTGNIAPTGDAPVVLAIGNSSRDTFRELIENGFDIKVKPIAVGYRIAHKQNYIDEVQYGNVEHLNGDAYKSESMDSQSGVGHNLSDIRQILGPATYKLTYDVGNGHSVYSFCMCPGGYIVNSSNKKGQLSINGMSYNDRAGKYANSAIVETISPEDILDSHQRMELKMIEFQEKVEKVAFELEKGYIPYVASAGGDICSEDLFKGKAKYCEKLKSVYENCGLKFDINKDIEMALNHFNKIMPGFFEVKELSPTEYVIAGVETRTSSPVKLDRDEDYMCNVKNFYPCGEGLGHGGGIMSCAADGVNVAMKIIEKRFS